MIRKYFYAAINLPIFFILPLLAAQSEAKVSEKEFLESVSKNDLITVKRYLDQNGDVNAEDFQGNTALMFAVQNGNVELIRLLIEKRC